MRARTLTPLLGAAAIALTVAGCQRYDKPGATVDTAAIETAIKADEKKWNDEFQAKPRSLDALIAHYAENAYFVAPGVMPSNGMAEITKTYQEALKDPNFNITFGADTVRVAGAGDVAVARGRFTETFSDPTTKGPVSHQGSFITVYKKQADGGWKVVEDWAVADPGAPKPVVPATRAKLTGL